MSKEDSLFADIESWECLDYAENQRKSIVCPTGNWRFLTPFDVIQEGDLGRFTADAIGPLNKAESDWAPIPSGDGVIPWCEPNENSAREIIYGTAMSELGPGFEAIRKLDDNATYVWRGNGAFMSATNNVFEDNTEWEDPDYAAGERRKTVYPVGNWRFLTPFDVIQKGDLGRFTIEAEHATGRVDADWSPIPSKRSLTAWRITYGGEMRLITQGVHMSQLGPGFQAIRPIDDEATFVWRE